VLPEAIVSGEQVTPGGKLVAIGQVTVTAPTKPPLGVSVIVEFAVDIVPAAVGAVITIGDVAVIVKLPVLVTLTVKLAEVDPA